MALNFIQKLFGNNNQTPKAVAKDRLKFVLLHDRADIPAPVMEEIRRKIFAVLAEYVEIDEAALEVSLEQADQEMALVANIPIRRVITHLSDSPTG
jgi:cell division topological specificity factor